MCGGVKNRGWLAGVGTDMEKDYKIAQAWLWAWQFNTQNMCKNDQIVQKQAKIYKKIKNL